MSKLLSPLLITGLILTLACIAPAANPPGDSTDDWPSYGQDPGGMRYSPLTQINRENVAKLKLRGFSIPAISQTDLATRNGAALRPHLS